MTQVPMVSRNGLDAASTLAQLTGKAHHGASVYVDDLRETLTFNANLKRWTAEDRTVYATSPRFLFDDFKNAGRAASCISPVWTVAKGSAAAAPIVTKGSAAGIVPLLTTKTAGSLAADGVQLSGPGLDWTPASGAFALECRIGFGQTGASAGDALTAVQYFIGLTDTVALEAPVTISTNTLTAVADNCVGLLFNAAMSTKTLRAVAVNATAASATDMTAATSKLTTDTYKPVVGDYVRFRFEVSALGTVGIYIDIEDGNGFVLQKTLTLAVAAAATLAPIILVYPTSTAAEKTLTVDYVWMV